MPQGGAGQPGRRNYTPRKKVYTQQAAKDRFIELIQNGMNINPALEKVERSRKTYEDWRANDPKFAAKVDQARQLRQIDKTVVRGERLGFAEWRRKYLGVDTPWHQQQWVDMLEGREPRDLHPAQTYVKGTSPNRVLINCPPFHGKSIAITVDYSVYRLCMDPSYRILIVSAGSELAGQFLYGIKERLTSPDFIDLQKAYAPDGGWETTSESWTESKIIFGGDVRASGTRDRGSHEKDPNVQIVGMSSKIYGRRCDLAIVDDGVDETNVSAYKKQINWLTRTVASRIELGGKLLVVGTRIASVDLYSELMNPDSYANGRVPWTYLASPAILEEGETPDQHVTLWPYAQEPWVAKDQQGVLTDTCICGRPECSDGVLIDGQRRFARWDGLHLELGPRADTSETMWALVYQQRSVSENATFPEHSIKASTNGLRYPGVLHPDRAGHPFGGMLNKYVVAGLDPAVKGFAGIVVLACDRETQKRYLLNAWNMKAPTGDQLKQKMREVTEEYGVDEWRVEKTGLLQFFTQDSSLRMWFATRGIRFTEHLTSGASKWDPAFGVSSLAPLFGEYDRAWDDKVGEWREISAPLIELPRPSAEGVKTLMHQLITWTPELDPNKVPCDMVMALWFAEVGAREWLNAGRGVGTITALANRNKFISPRSQKNRRTINFADFRGGL